MLTAIYKSIDFLSERLGRLVAWFTLLMVLVQFVVVLQRYVFSIGNLYMQESITYLHGALIMLASAYTLLHDGHVRVDIFYRPASARMKDITDLVGSLLFLLPVCLLIVWSAWPNVVLAVQNLEGSTETSGIPYKYVLKSLVIVFAVLMAIQGISQAIKAGLRLAGVEVDDPRRGEVSTD